MARSSPPPDRRWILCTYCDLPLEIAAEAKSVNCHHCHKRVITEAMVVKEYVAVRRFAVANSMHITKKGIVYASVRADDLQVDGILEGDALALGAARLTKKSRVKGNLRATSLDLELGASFVGHLAIGRDQVPELEALASVATLPGTSGGAAGAPR
jgi:hypothetical protein